MPDVFLYAGEPSASDVKLGDPSVLRGGGSPQTVAVSGRSSVSTFGGVTAAPGGVAVAVAGRTSVSTFGTTAAAPGPVTTAPAGRTSVSTFGAITVAPGGVSTAVAGRTSTSSFGVIVPAAGGVSVPVSGRTSISSFGTVVPAAGNVNTGTAGHTSASTFGTVTPAAGPVSVAVTGRTSVSLFGTVAIGGQTPEVLPIPSGLLELLAPRRLKPKPRKQWVTAPGHVSVSSFGTVTALVGPAPAPLVYGPYPLPELDTTLEADLLELLLLELV